MIPSTMSPRALQSKTRRFAMALLLVTTCTCVALPSLSLAQAKEAPLSGPQIKARHALITQANAHWHSEEYELALPLYARAYKIQPHPDVLYRIGQTHEALGHYKEAARRYESYLQEEPFNPYAEKITAHIAELEKKSEVANITELVIRTKPPGATVLIDEEVAQDASPIRVFRSPGDYTITVRLEGYLEEEEEVTLSGGGSIERFFELTPEVEPEPDVPEEEEIVQEEPEEEPEERVEPEVDEGTMTYVDISAPLPLKLLAYAVLPPATLTFLIGTLGLIADGGFISLWGPFILLGGLGMGASSYVLFIRDWNPRIETAGQGRSLGMQRSERPTAQSVFSSSPKGVRISFEF